MNITLKPLPICNHEEQMAVYHARNHPNIRRWMLNDQEISVNEHLTWLAGLEKEETSLYWAAFMGETLLGVVSLSNIMPRQQTASIGIYVHPENTTKGMGRVLLIWLLSHAFHGLGARKLSAEMIEGNIAAAKLYKTMGFAPEGLRQNHVLHQDGTHNLLVFGLEKTAWQLSSVMADHADLLAEYQAELTTVEETPWNIVLKQIQNARAKNNINWMSLLKISLENATERSLEVVDEILRLDKEISDLAAKLVETARPSMQPEKLPENVSKKKAS